MGSSWNETEEIAVLAFALIASNILCFAFNLYIMVRFQEMMK